MSQAPYMPVFTDALLGDTLHLSAEEFGCYMLLLFATWSNNGRALPDDDQKLARICRCGQAHWRRALRPALIGFFENGDGLLHQKRLEKEWKSACARRDAARANGMRGGRPTATDNPLENHDQAKATGFDPVNPTPKLTETGSKATKAKAKAKEESKEEEAPPGRPPPTPEPMHYAPMNGASLSHASEVKSNGRGSRLPADWQPSPEDREFAADCGLDPFAVAQTFADYWHAEAGAKASKRDWPATFRIWCRREQLRYAGGHRPRALSIAAALSRVRFAGDC